MTVFAISQSARKWLTCAVAAALVLTSVPAQSRCESYNILRVLIEVAAPKKPVKPQQCVSCPMMMLSCPQGVCRGATCMPCCPVVCTPQDCQQCSVDRCGTACRQEICDRCAACEAKLDKPMRELRRLCAEHERMIRELQAIISELQGELRNVRSEVEQLRQIPQVIYPYNIYPPNQQYPQYPQWPGQQWQGPQIPQYTPGVVPGQTMPAPSGPVNYSTH
jgi:hypothetical protein